MNASPQSFPKSARLLKRADFLRVYETGRRHFGAHMTFFYLDRAVVGGVNEAAGKDGPRIGFTVSRALGGSVDRNRIRRRVREAVRMNLSALHRATDVVINPKRSAAKAALPVLLAEVAKGFAVIERGAK
ncbi:MAG: ribonuclease P protein component [Candidatus Koribacter versatilis]|uniref:Ribonuclease P protein component n=1 Tax=Candidatus Korobacter versatilis TaxID=658062 RepID=A0A932A7E0_9BACT|nr:ribonuclease P protein component [Candidatus Koribacter versatilis]